MTCSSVDDVLALTQSLIEHLVCRLGFGHYSLPSLSIAAQNEYTVSKTQSEAQGK